MNESKRAPKKSTRAANSGVLIVLCLLIQSCQASGIFELSLSSLVDSLGRDLRDDCCAWQNGSATTASTNHLTAHHQHHNNNQAQQQTAPCDPSKCQLIIRICVKNYQMQIEPSQCTFGELSAQVLPPADPSSSSSSPLAESNFLPYQHQHHYQANNLVRQTSAAAASNRAAAPRAGFGASTNIHHQRLLSQTQAAAAAAAAIVPPAAASPSTTAAFFYNQHQSSMAAAAAARNSQQQRSSLSGQPRALRTVAFHQPISFPFNFTWPGSFSLIIDAWFESPLQQVAANPHMLGHPTTTYDLYKRQLIIKHSMRGWLGVKQEWTNDIHKTDSATLAYSYRVTCQPNYFGDQCNILCRPRDDFYGHYTCSQQGNIVCLPGWQGSYCLEPICQPGCTKDQGNCSRPNECQCRSGWQGAACEQCQTYPGCVHGSCGKPFECICEEGWGGLLCNEDLNYCANHQPCKNDGICTNAFDSNGVGSYTCSCPPGFEGRNCERRIGQPAIADQDPTFAAAAAAAPPPAASLPSNTNAVGSGDILATSNVSTISTSSASNVPLQQQQVDQQQVTKQAKQQPSKYSHQTVATRQAAAPLSSFHYPLSQAASTVAAINSGHHSGGGASTALDTWVMTSWAVIMICSILLVLVFSFRAVIERASQRGGAAHQQHQSGGWHHHARDPHHHGSEGSHAEDVATLQNHQNLCKSRTSLAAYADHKSLPTGGHYDRVLSLVDGYEHMASIYGHARPQYQHLQQHQPGTSNRFHADQNIGATSSPKRRGAGDKGKKSSHQHQQQQQQQYQSQRSLHATQENNSGNNNGTDSSSEATSTSSEAPAPPPPYTIAQSTHSYPNLAYQTMSSHYSPAASAHYHLSAVGASGQRAPKLAAGQPAHQPTAISNALYGSHSGYAGIPVVAAPAGPSNRQPGGHSDGSNGNAGNGAAANSTYQSPYYVIYPLPFMAN